MLQYPWLFASFMPAIVASKLGVKGVLVAQGEESSENGVLKKDPLDLKNVAEALPEVEKGESITTTNVATPVESSPNIVTTATAPVLDLKPAEPAPIHQAPLESPHRHLPVDENDAPTS